jgi:glycosyltransferase EpsE
MVRKNVFDQVGGYSEGKKLMRVEDKHLWYKIYAAGHQGANLPDILYSYRDDPNGYRKRKLRYRFNNAYVDTLIIRHFRLSPIYYLRCLRPIMVGLLPMPLYIKLHKWKMERNQRVQP